MTLEESIYSALTSSSDLVNLVADRIFPTDQPPFDVPPPWVYYTLPTSGPENQDLQGDYPRTLNGLEVDILATSYLQGKAIRNAVYNAIHKYRGGQIRAAFWSGEQSTQIEEGYHFTVNFSVHGTSANLVTRFGSQARIVTENNLFRVFPDGTNNRFELNQTGGTLNGAFQVVGSLLLNGQEITPASPVTPGGSTGQIQFNNAGTFAGLAGSSIVSNCLTLANGISSPGTGSGSERIGSGASTGTTTQSTAIGASSICTGDYAVAIGYGSSAAAWGVAIGRTASTTGAFAVAIGWNVTASQGVCVGVECNNSVGGITVGYQNVSPGGFYQNLFGRGLGNTLPAVNHSTWFGSLVDAGATQTFGYAGKSSSVARAMFNETASWINSTDGSRRAQVTRQVWDTSARTVARDYSDGSRGYRAHTVHTTAPADADLSNGEVCFYTNGSGHFAIKLKDSSGTVRTGTVALT